MRTGHLLAIAMVAAACTPESADEVGASRSALCTRTALPSPAGKSWRWGGGHDYPDLVDTVGDDCSNPVYIDGTYSAVELVSAVNNAAPGTVFYFYNGIEIDLTGQPTLVLGDQVWLSSGRGRLGGDSSEPGALLSRSDTQPLIEVTGSDVRITGLRLWGPDPEVCAPGCSLVGRECCDDDTGVCHYTCGTNVVVGVMVHGDSVEVDNCDIAGWTHAGVYVDGSLSAHIHHNYIHHVQRAGLGYPVVIGGNDTASNARIEYNRFQNYRHAVASSGYRLHEYTAYDNLALANTIGRVFDVHQDPGGTSDAGGTTIVQNNKIMVPNFYSFDVRATPAEGAYFFGNCTVRTRGSVEPASCAGAPPPSEGYQDDNDSTVCRRGPGIGGVFVGTDPSGVDRPNSHGNQPDSCAALRWCLSSGAKDPYKYLNISSHGIDSMAFGNFDGDGRTDVFRASGSNWYVSFDGTGAWTPVKADSTPLANLRFGDFSGDGKTDVFRSQGGHWEYVAGEPESGGTWGGWIVLRNDTIGVGQLAVGYFDGEEPANQAGAKADIFRANGDTWEFRKNGSGTTWYPLNSGGPWSNEPVNELGFGDFNNDGLTDVFSATGSATGAWRLHLGGKGSQTLSSPNDLEVAKLRFADMDGDARTDVFYGNGRRWRYKSAGAGGWIDLGYAAEESRDVWVANLDLNSRADVFFPGCQ